ncbi:secretin and TonB N-terminal domain-containing protein [Massilia horti]|uniref:Tetratricopeptide repeat protein n=1 Tax=Massilia horti TaxID=2562153 RepID=A0A4Y9T4D7_9BURK|nr:secretin and TonB N-terminal domain-containing protein [Massilia horti]TFW34409.1 tetratricopeptide repeat protein [Massilia horti]
MTRYRRAVLIFATGMLIAGCAADRMHSAGLDLIEHGKPEEGVRLLEQAAKSDPGNVVFRSDFLNQRSEQITRLLADADDARNSGKWELAELTYNRVLSLEGSNVRAAAGLSSTAQSRRHAALLEQAESALQNKEQEKAAALVRRILAEAPQNGAALAIERQIEEINSTSQLAALSLHSAFRKPITLQFRDASLRVVLEALARATGVDFILDKDVRPDLRTTVFLRQAPLEDALALVLQTNNLEKKVLNANSVLIYASTPEKQKEYRELVVKGFYLANADVNKTHAMIKSMLKTKDTFVDEKLNLLMIRDTPEAVRLAEKLIAMQDLPEPEVMLDVEVLEVKRSRLNDLGIQWTSQFTVSPLMSTPALLTDLRGLNASRLGVTTPSATVNVRRELGDANILANPRIRARNREKAKILIGDKVPVSTSTATATGLVSESVQYLDVGIKLDAEPNVYLDGDVAIRVGLEVSTITREIRTPGGSLAYQIGSRSASTVLRLRDGETQVLAGLISDQDRHDASRIPGLGDLPIVGRLFGSQKDGHEKTEIVLSITPHLIRNIERPSATAGEFWSGTESALNTRPLRLGTAAEGQAGTTATSGDRKTTDLNSTASPTRLVFSWIGPKKIAPNEPFTVALRLESDGGVRSLPLQFGFDPLSIELINVAEGSYFKKANAETSLSHSVNASEGKVMVSIVRAGTSGTRGNDDVVILTFKPLNQKNSELKLMAAAPTTVGDKGPAPTMPAPLIIKLGD